MHRKPRWIQNMETKDRSRMERSRLRRIAWSCNRGDFKEFSFLKLHYEIDRYRVADIISEELNVSSERAKELYTTWVTQAETTQN